MSRQSRARGAARGRAMARLGMMLVLLGAALAPGSAFNLDVERPAVYSGPAGSYFGFAVDFFAPDPFS